MAVVKIMAHGQITIPKKIRDTLGIKKGDLAEAELRGEEIVITPKQLVNKREAAWEEMKTLLSLVHQQNRDQEFTEEEIAAEVLEAVAEHRREKRARKHEC
jgi:AbrB family looped-hinge helix DNA binding protein